MTRTALTTRQSQWLERHREVLGDGRELLFENPGFDRARVLTELRGLGESPRPCRVDGWRFDGYLLRAVERGLYTEAYCRHFGDYFRRKALEHFASFELLRPRAGRIYMDVASSGSCVPRVVAALYGVEQVWRQDLTYEAGVHGETIGSDAADIPLPDASVDLMGLHCSFEHFEGDADTGFVREAARLLRPGGAACIVPLYMSNRYHLLSNVEMLRTGRMPAFEPDAPIYFSPRPNNVHGRFYDAPTLRRRVLEPARAAGLHASVIEFVVEDCGAGLGTGLGLMLEQPAPGGA